MKRKMKSIAILLLVAIFFVPSIHDVKAKTEEEQPTIFGGFGIAIEANTGEILYEKNAHEKAYPASTTKIMTAILLSEHIKDGELMETSERAAGQEASNLHFKLTPGEKMTKEDALYALMLISANDVAMAIAEQISGSQEEFAKLMNEKAKEIGMKDTHFVTPNGLHDPDHYTTVYDMALLAREAMNYDDVAQVMGTSKTTISVQNQEGESRQIEIQNPSKIHDNPLAIGGKTGYTNAASNTLVEILEKDNKRVISVVMKTTLAEEYNDIEIMGNYAFDKIKTEKIVEKGKMIDSKMVGGQKVGFLTNEDFYYSYVKGEEQKIEKKVTIDFKGNEIQKGEKVGKVTYFYKGEKIKEIDLISDGTIVVEKADQRVLFWLGILLPIPFYVLYVVYNAKRRKKIVS